jgi:hypothetical protein
MFVETNFNTMFESVKISLFGNELKNEIKCVGKR